MDKKKYNQDWFIKRAFNSLKKISENKWDYSDSLLLYTSSGSKTYESLQQVNTPYFKLVTKPEREYLQNIAENVANILPHDFEYIDLGPGTEHKEQLLFDELKKQGKTFTYLPVDISDHFLSLAEDHALKQNIPVKKIKGSFEELPEILGQPIKPRFVSLGLTFSNYNPQEIIKLLKDIAGDNGYCFINAQMRDRVDMDSLLKVYQEDAQNMADEKLQLIGLDSETDVTPRVVDDGFKVWCNIVNSNDKLRNIGIEENDKLLVFQSLRYTKDFMQKELEHENYESFDIDSSFVAYLLKNK